MNKEEYIKKWLNDSLSEEERIEFEKTQDFHSLKKLSNALDQFKAPKYDEDKAWGLLQADMQQAKSPKGKQVVVNWKPQLMKVAAVIVLLISALIFFFSDRTTTVATSLAEKTTVYLPDSSMIILNALSSISYDKSDWDKERQVDLKGEALFKVAKGSDFEVLTSAGNVKVLGTEFNVKSRASALEVICYEGLVEVKKDQHKVRLKPNHIFRSYDKNYTVTRKDLDHGPHLTANESAFYSTPYREVIAEFERHYKVEISTQNIELAQEFTGRFPHDNKELALKAITVPLDISFSIKDENRVILSRND